MTTPWEIKRGGARLANGPIYSRLMKGINTRTDEGQELGFLIAAAYAAADEFTVIYPRLVEEAKADLNGLYEAKNYPAPYAIRGLFSIAVSESPLPLSPESLTLQFLGREDLDRLRARLAGTWERSEAAAIGDLYRRMVEKVGHMARTLADPEAKFRDSLVNNLVELADLIPALNFKGDADLDRLTVEMRERLTGIDPETLRRDMMVRGQIAGEAGTLLKQITGAGSRFIDLS